MPLPVGSAAIKILSSVPAPPADPLQPLIVSVPAIHEAEVKVSDPAAPPACKVSVEFAVRDNAPMVMSDLLLASRIPPANVSPPVPSASLAPNITVPWLNVVPPV